MGLCKTSDPLCVAIFDPRATTNHFGRGSLDEATYQRPGPSGLRQEDFLSFQLKNIFLAPMT